MWGTAASRLGWSRCATFCAALLGLAACGRSELLVDAVTSSARDGGHGGAGTDAISGADRLEPSDGESKLPDANAADSSNAPDASAFCCNSACTSALQAGSPWPTWGRCPDHRGRTEVVGPQTPTVRWMVHLNAVGEPVIGWDGTIYVGGGAYIQAVNPDGSIRFSYGVWPPEGTGTGALGQDGSLYFIAYSRGLFALDALGSKEWEADMSATSIAPGVGPDGTLYVGVTSSDNLHGGVATVHPDGSIGWVFTMGQGTVSDVPAVGADGAIYFGNEYGGFYALNPDGSLRFSFGTRYLITSSPAVGADGTVYFGSGDGNIYALDGSGNPKWSFPRNGGGDNVDSSPAIASDGTIYMGGPGGVLYAFHPDGTLAWSFGTSDTYNFMDTAVIGGDGTIYVGDWKGILHAIGPDGVERWELHTAGYVVGPPAIGADGTLYVGDHMGNLYAIGP